MGTSNGGIDARPQTGTWQPCGRKEARIYWYLLISFGALLLLKRWITRHVQGIGYLLTEDGQIALILYFWLMLPGVLLHEFSHALAAWILRVKVRRFSIGLGKRSGQKVALGSVDIAKTGPIRAALIGLAPLVSGCAAIMAISSQALGMGTLTLFGVQRFWQDLQGIYSAPDFWVWMYLIFAIGNAMIPSTADTNSWGVSLIFVCFAGAVFYFTGLFDIYSDPLESWARRGVYQLTHAFAFIAIVDLAFAVLLFLVEQGLALLGFGRLRYR